MAAQGNPEENGYAERLMRTIKEEELDLSEYEEFADALGQIGQFIEEVYQRKRIHSALGYLTPEEFEVAWWQAQAEEVFALKPAEKLSNFRGPLQKVVAEPYDTSEGCLTLALLLILRFFKSTICPSNLLLFATSLKVIGG
ncbi:MAG TPA: hypothetical protein ENI60_03485 [Candidatus Fraserbacteria bacterium]|nr:hypothetical protein [Candidatus Fraserbacteria bacterium]